MRLQAVHSRRGLVQLVTGMGMAGLFLLAVVDSSFIPLPIPGATDILLRSDSQLLINQLTGRYRVKRTEGIARCEYCRRILVL